MSNLKLKSRHRLLCGDSTSEADVARLMDEAKADMMFTDPPYGVSFVGIKGTMYVNGKKQGTDSSEIIKADELRGSELTDLFKHAIKNACSKLKDNAAVYVFFAINRSAETLAAMETSGLTIRNWLVWDKGNVGFHAMGAQYKPNFESFIYCHKKNHSPNWFGNQKQQTIWRHSVERLGIHPTIKPQSLIVNAIENSSKRNDTILDLFGGSGSTLIASETTNRQSLLMELDPKYCDVIVARWEALTNEKAVLHV